MYDNRFDKLEVKIDKLDERLDRIDVTLAKQNECLETHIKRTNLLEKEIEPIKAMQQQVLGVGKLLGVLSILAVIISSVYKFLQ